MRIGWVSGWMRVREYRWKKGRRRKQQQPKQDLHLIQFEFTFIFALYQDDCKRWIWEIYSVRLKTRSQNTEAKKN